MTANLTARLLKLLHGSRPEEVPQAQPAAPTSWTARMQAALRLSLGRRERDVSHRIELLHRLSLGGKKALLLVEIDGRRMLAGVGEDGPPSITALDLPYPVRSAPYPSAARRLRSRRGAARARSRR